MPTDTKAKDEPKDRTDAERAAAEREAQGSKPVRDPNGVMTTVAETEGDPVGASNTPRDPNPLKGETGSAYTGRMRKLSFENAESSGEAITGRHGEDVRSSAPDTIVPLTGVAPAEDPVGVSTGRVEQTQIEQDSPIKQTVPGERDRSGDEHVKVDIDLKGGQVAGTRTDTTRDTDARTNRDGGDASLEGEGDAKRGKLPEDFPGRAALEEADLGTYAKVRKAKERDELKDVAGIGPATIERIEAEL